MKCVQIGIILGVLFVIFIQGVGAQPAMDAPPALNRFTLDNGLRVWHLPRKESPSVAIALVVRAGGRYEDDANNGVSHFLEHFLFTETERWKEGEVFQVMNRLGGVNNAVTSREHTTWYNIAAPEYFEPAMDWMAEVVLHSKMAEEHIEKERQIIFRENGGPDSWFIEWCNRLGYGGPSTKELYQLLYPNSTLHLPTIGQNESLENMDHATLTAYYDKHYVPNNALLLIVGNIDDTSAREAARRYFGEWEAGEDVPWPATPEMPSGDPIRIVQRGMSMQDEGLIWMGARTDGIPDPDQWPLKVLGHILRERLFQKLRIQEGLVYSVNTAHYTYTDVGDFRIHAGAKREHLVRVEALIRAELDLIRSGDVDATEVTDAQKTLIGRHALAMESNHAHAFALLDYTHLPEGAGIPDYDTVIKAVTSAEVQRVAQRYLETDKLYTIVYDPICTANELAIIASIFSVIAVAASVLQYRRKRRRRREAAGMTQP